MEAITNIFRDAFFFTYSTFSFLKYENADISVTQKMGHVLNTQNSLTRPGLFPICVYSSAPERSSVPFFLSLCSNHTRPISDSCTHGLIILWNVRLFFLQCGLPRWLTLKNLPAMPKTWVQSLGWEDPLRREGQPTPVFLPGESHGQRPWRATAHGVTRSRTRLSDQHFHSAI